MKIRTLGVCKGSVGQLRNVIPSAFPIQEAVGNSRKGETKEGKGGNERKTELRMREKEIKKEIEIEGNRRKEKEGRGDRTEDERKEKIYIKG